MTAWCKSAEALVNYNFLYNLIRKRHPSIIKDIQVTVIIIIIDYVSTVSNRALEDLSIKFVFIACLGPS
jgi:hypothetical protein